MGNVIVAGNRAVASVLSTGLVSRLEEKGLGLIELPSEPTVGMPFLNILIATDKVLVVNKESCVGWRLVGCILLLECGFEVGFGNDFP